MAQYRVPKNDLDPCIEVAKAIHDQGGGQVDADQLAAFLGYKSPNNGAYLNRVAAAKMFGLIEGASPKIKTTALALRILKPEDTQSEAVSRVDAFTNVPLFRDLFQKEFPGTPIPPKEGLVTVLTTKYGIPKAQASFTRARFMKSAEQAWLFRVDPNKMIRPSQGVLASSSKAPGDLGEKTPPPPADSKLPKIIEGVLEEVPWNKDWEEAQFNDWADFFIRAARRHFGFPSAKGGGG